MPLVFYDFCCFRIDVARRTLLRDGSPVPLSPKVFDTLLELVRHSGQVMTKDELLTAIWPDVVVEENSLARNISTLRKALGERASDHQYIVTLPGKGYSFVAPVREGSAAETREAAARPAFPLRRLLLPGTLAAAIGAAALLIGSIQRAAPPPFAVTTTARLTSAGHSLKAAISPDGRYIAHTVIVSGQESLRVRGTSPEHDIEIVPPQPVHYLGIVFGPR